MAEARSAVSELRTLSVQDEQQSYRNFFITWRKTIVRTYFRTRNSIRNGVWPTSISNLVAGFTVIWGLLLTEPPLAHVITKWLWDFGEVLSIPAECPRWLHGCLIAWLIGLSFFVVLMKLRQYLLRLLLSYRGWMYEPLRVQSTKTLLWACFVRLVSGYQPSLYSCQRALPKLPVPSLTDTIDKLIESLRPLTTAEELANILQNGENFKNELGPKLQRILILRSWLTSNYVSDWWEKYIYLMNRNPLPINSNYYGMDQSYWKPTHSQISRAATVIHHCLLFRRSIEREELAPLVIRGTIPICMAQYDRIFSTVRIPGVEIDQLQHFDFNASKFIIVIRNGIYYKVDVYDSKNQLLSPIALEQQFQWVTEDADNGGTELSDDEKSIAALTTLDRTKWAELRKTYLSDGINLATVTLIDRAILIVILTKYVPENLTEKGKFLLHGDGTCIWFDKSINFIFFNDGQAGLNCEHSMADAPVVGHIWEYVITKEVLEKLYCENGNSMPLSKTFKQGWCRSPHRLRWNISEQLAGEIQAARKLAILNNNDLDLEVKNHVNWGKGIMKQFKISPDAFVQLALQLAYYKNSHKFAQTYEASMTRLYHYGRTETVRSCTVETVQFVKAMTSGNVSNAEKMKLLRIAAEKHQQLYRDAMSGKGIDRHLFALYVACRGLGHDSKFLTQILSRPWTLSTSQQPQQQQTNVPDANLHFFRDKLSPGGGFGPVSDDGYGVSYMLSSDHNMFFHVSSKKSSLDTDSKVFMDQIWDSLDEMRQLLEHKNCHQRENIGS